MLFSTLNAAERVQGGAQTSGVPQKPTSSIGRRARIMRTYVLLTLACALAGSAEAQFAEQGGKLVGTGTSLNAHQGTSVALSADGNTAIVGGPTNDDGNGAGGAAWVYTRSGGVWTQQGSKLVGTGAMVRWSHAEQGYSVALSADGNTAIVGGPTDNGTTSERRGCTHAREACGPSRAANWSVLVRLAGRMLQGYSVALSADGNTAIVGGPNDNTAAGAAWVYTRSGGVWTQQGSKLVGTGAVGGAEQGYSVALSADGNTAMVGGPATTALPASERRGCTRAREACGPSRAANWSVLVRLGSADQGWSVALSADGNTAIVGGPDDNAARRSGVGVHALGRRVDPAGQQTGRYWCGWECRPGHFGVAVG